MRLSGNEALKTKQEKKRFPNFGKKWKSGDKLRVLYPVFWDEINEEWAVLIGKIWGHKIDINEVQIGGKRFFVPSNSEIHNGEPTRQDALYQFSKIARLFIDGEKMAELEKNRIKSKGDSTLQRSLDAKTEEKFKDKKPAVQRLDLLITTECLAIPLNSDDTVDVDNVGMVTQETSEAKLNALKAILRDPAFAPKSHDAKYIEVQYTFGSTNDKKVDGKVDPKGVTYEYTTEFRSPDVWKSKIEPMLDSIPDDSELIMKRNSSYKRVSEEVILAGLTTYALQHSDGLSGVVTAEQLDTVKRNAEFIISLNLPLEAGKASAVLEDYATSKAVVPMEQGEAPSIMDLIDPEDIKKAKESNESESVLDDEPDEEEPTGTTASSFTGFSNM